jgi:5-methylthioadenosine/S-adenosylhomocysteine deaminase
VPGTLLLGTVVTLDRSDRIIHDGAVLVEEGKISIVGRRSEVSRDSKPEETVGGRRSIILPGLVNTHTHLSMTLFKGVLEGLTGMKWLKRAWAIEAELKPEDIRLGALLGSIEMMKSGTTCFADHYFEMDQVAESVQQAGIRGALAEAILDFGDEERGKELAKKGRRFVERWHNRASGRVTCLMGPHSVYTCTPGTLRLVKEYATELGVGIHLHLSEHREEAAKVKRMWGARPIELLDSLGFLGRDVLAAHVTFADDAELEILAKRRVNVNNNVYCKMKGGQGISRAREMLDLGINVSLGTDGPASHNNLDMFEEMKLAIAAQALKYRRPDALTAKEAIRMATLNGARALHLDKTIGSLERGKDADIVMLDADTSRGTPFYNIPTMVAQTLCGRDVRNVMVRGRFVVRDFKAVGIDEERVIEEAERSFYGLMERSGIRLGGA